MSSKRILLSESEMPKAWYNLQADLPEPCPPPPPPCHKPADRPGRLGADLRQGTDRSGGKPGTLDRYPRRSPTRAGHLASRSFGPCGEPGKRLWGHRLASTSRTKATARREATNPNTGRSSSLLQQRGRHLPTDHRDRCWPMGKRPVLCLQPVRHQVQGLHGQNQLPTETLQAIDDACLGRGSHTEPLRRNQCRTLDPGRRSDCPGSLGMAISEAVEMAVSRDDAKYTLGSVLNHVMLHQTVIGLEAEKQMKIAEDYPDVIVGCVGGGSNFAGLAFPFLRHKIAGKDIRFVAAEPQSCPTMSRGEYRYDFGDTVKMTPLVKMHTLGHSFVPPGIHAGGLRYHGMAPLVSFAAKLGPRRSRCLPSVGVLRGRQTLRRNGRNHPRSGNVACHQGDDCRGIEMQGDGRREVHPLQLQRPWTVRSRIVRSLLRRRTGRLRPIRSIESRPPWPNCRSSTTERRLDWISCRPPQNDHDRTGHEAVRCGRFFSESVSSG